MPSAALLPHTDLDRDRAALARRWPAAVRDVLLIAAQVDRFNRRAVALGALPIIEPPVAVVQPMWSALLTEPDSSRGGQGAGR